MPARALLSELQLRFNADELRQLVALRLGADAGAIFGDRATANDAALQLVEWAKRHDRLCDLAAAAAQERPDNATLQALSRLMPLVCEQGGQGRPSGERIDRMGYDAEWERRIEETLKELVAAVSDLRVEVAVLKQRVGSQQRSDMPPHLIWVALLLMAGLTAVGIVAAVRWP